MKAKCCMMGVVFIRLFCVFFVVGWTGLCLATGNNNTSSYKKLCVNEMIISLYGEIDASIPLLGSSTLGRYGFYPIDYKCSVYRCFVCNKRIECKTNAELYVVLNNLGKKDYRSRYHDSVAARECIFSSCYEADSEPRVSKEYIIKYNNIVHVLRGKSLLGKMAENFLLTGYKEVSVKSCVSEDSDLAWINPCYCDDIKMPVNGSDLKQYACDYACDASLKSLSVNDDNYSFVNESKPLANSQKVDEIDGCGTTLSKMLDGGGKRYQIMKRARSYQMYATWRERMKTFETWRFPYNASAEEFVDAGFFYSGRDGVVRCFHCDVCTKPTGYQNPLEMHRRLSPNCEFIATIKDDNYINLTQDNAVNAQLSQKKNTQGKPCDKEYLNMLTCSLKAFGCLEADIDAVINKFEVKNNTIDDDVDYLFDKIAELTNYNRSREVEGSVTCNSNKLEKISREVVGGDFYLDKVKAKNSGFCSKQLRMKSFMTWPCNIDVDIEKMASSGFHYGEVKDHVSCFFCGGTLRDWESGDDPIVEHARWFPECRYLFYHMGQDFIDKVQCEHKKNLLLLGVDEK